MGPWKRRHFAGVERGGSRAGCAGPAGGWFTGGDGFRVTLLCSWWAAVVVCIVLASAPSATAQSAEPESGRVERLNRAFLSHLRNLGEERAIAVASIIEGWEKTYRGKLSGSFVPDALAVLYPQYREALEAFDDDRMADVVRLLEPLRAHGDPFLVANADYFHARALVALGRYEQVEQTLASIDTREEEYVKHTPYASHLWFIKGFCEARNLRFDQATRSLQVVLSRFADAPEAVRVGVRQLLLEIERRERGTLGEVATVMDYIADRLEAIDAAGRIRDRQQQVIAMLDRLIAEQEQREQQQGGGGQGRGKGRQSPSRSPGQARRESDAPGGVGRVGDQHAAPPADPGEMWGKLPPAERERILQSIRERFPSRYRQLVEQYYRALAEEK